MTCKSIDDRWDKGRGYDSQAFGEAITKYGVDDWTHEWIASTKDQEYALELETEYIYQYKTLFPNGYNIVPSTKVSPMMFETTRERHRAAMKHPRISKMSSDSNKKRWVTDKEKWIAALNDPEVKKKQSEWSKQFWSNPDNIRKRNEATKEFRESPEFRRSQSETAKSIFNAPNHRKKRSIQANERWSNPDYAIKQAEAIRTGYRKRLQEVGPPSRSNYRCLQCGMKSSACGIGNHQKKTKHTGKEKI